MSRHISHLSSFLWIACWLLVLMTAPEPGAAQDPLPKADPPLLTDRDHQLIRLEAAMRSTREEIQNNLNDTVGNQKLTTQKAELAWKQATLLREQHEYTAREYAEGISVQDRETLSLEITLARETLAADQERIAAILRDEMAGRPVRESEIMAARLHVEKSRFELEEVETRFELLLKYEHPNQIRKNQVAIIEAVGEEAIKEREYQLQQDRYDRRKSQSERLNAQTPEDLVLALLNEVIAKENRVVALTREIQSIHEQRPEDPARVADQLEQVAIRRTELQTTIDEIKSTLMDATMIAEEARQLRQRLFNAEKRLLFQRRALEAQSG